MMKKQLLLILIIAMPLCAFTGVHKFYVSVTQIEYAKEKQEVQIITRVFIDDFERLLQERYDESIKLLEKDEPKIVNTYITKYLKEKLEISINGDIQQLIFLGKEYEDDMVLCYLEIADVSTISSLEVSNKVLFDIYEEQQNIIRTNINSKRKSFILIPGNDKGLLNFK